MIFATTPSQTVGPYYAIGLPWGDGPHVVPAGTPGAIRLHGTIYDGRGDAIPDHLIETWQADPDGRFADLHGATAARPRWRASAASAAAATSTATAATRSSRSSPAACRCASRAGDVLQAPHVDVSLFARGLLDRVVTRIYFADEAGGQRRGPGAAVGPGRSGATRCSPSPTATGGYRFDIRLQGEGETVFFAV